MQSEYSIKGKVHLCCCCYCSILTEQRNKKINLDLRVHTIFSSFAGRKRPGETKEKIKSQIPTANDQGDNWHSKELKSDSKEANDLHSSGQRGAETASVKNQEHNSEGTWAFRPRAHSEFNKGSNKMIDSSTSGRRLTAEPAFDRSPYQQRSKSTLVEKPVVDQNQDQQKSDSNLEQKPAVDQNQYLQKSSGKLEEKPAVDQNQYLEKNSSKPEEKLAVDQSVDEKVRQLNENREREKRGGGGKISDQTRYSISWQQISSPNNSIVDWEKLITETLKDPDAKKLFLTRPLGIPFLIQCTVTRVKGSRTQLNSKYTLHLANSDTLIMAARKRKKSRTSCYILSSSEDEIKKDSSYSVGKLRTNYSGTEYMLYSSYGLKAVASRQVKQSRKGMRRRTTGSDEEEEEEECALKKEMGVIMFKQSSFTLRGGNPRKLIVVQPVPNVKAMDSNNAESVSCEFEKTWIPPRPEDSMLQVFKKAQGKKWGDVWSGLRKDLLVYTNKEPEWDDELNAFCLDFGGRVTKTSAKNCQVAAVGDEGLGLAKGDIILQFGKTSGNTFSLDFRYPFCPIMAFSVALASMDDKHTNII